MDAEDEQGLRPIDVADAGDHRLVEQEVADPASAASHLGDHRLWSAVASQRIRSEPIDDLVADVRRVDGADGRAAEVDRHLVADHPHADRAARFGGLRVVHPELAEQTEVNMPHLPGRPPVEEVLSVGLDVVEQRAVDAGRIRGESSLRTGHRDGSTGEEFLLVAGDLVNRVAFGHGR